MKKLRIFIICLLIISTHSSWAQSQDSIQLRRFFENEFRDGKCYEWLRDLCYKIGPRLSGSENAAKAVVWAEKLMRQQGFDSVWLQPVMVPHWVRGDKEQAYIVCAGKKIPVHICALGNSVGTGDKGITADILEVHGLGELEKLGKEKVQGKIVFYNGAFDDIVLNAGEAYGKAVGQRGRGLIEAATYGAVGVVVRSMTHAMDDYPHTGATSYKDSLQKIPGCAISTNDAQILDELIHTHTSVQFYFRQTSRMEAEVLSYNVVAEIKGSTYPEEIITVGGHLDSWDLAQGAHDDGTGVVQSIEALRLFSSLGIRPKRTLRCCLFMNEENGLRGGLKYAELAVLNHEKHIAAIETDAGGFMPRDIGVTDAPEKMPVYQYMQTVLAPYGVQNVQHDAWGGADIGPLKKTGTVLFGFHPDGQKYFDYHHTAQDTFDKVNKRELQFGVVTLSGLLWMISEHGLMNR